MKTVDQEQLHKEGLEVLETLSVAMFIILVIIAGIIYVL